MRRRPGLEKLESSLNWLINNLGHGAQSRLSDLPCSCESFKPVRSGAAKRRRKAQAAIWGPANRFGIHRCRYLLYVLPRFKPPILATLNSPPPTLHLSPTAAFILLVFLSCNSHIHISRSLLFRAIFAIGPPLSSRTTPILCSTASPLEYTVDVGLGGWSYPRIRRLLQLSSTSGLRVRRAHQPTADLFQLRSRPAGRRMTNH